LIFEFLKLHRKSIFPSSFHILQFAICITLVILIGCTLVKKEGVLNQQGYLVVYLNLDTTHTPPSLDFTLEELWLEDESGAKTPLSLQQKEIDTSSAARQIVLAHNELTPGFYTKIGFKITRAMLIKEGGTQPLELAEEGLGHVLITLKIVPDKTTNLFLDWAPEASIGAENTFLPVIEVRKGAAGLKKLLLYVSNSQDNYLSVIDRSSHQVIDTITVGDSPMGMVLSENGDYLYVANYSSNTISIIETFTNRLVDTIALNIGIGPTELNITAKTSTLYVTAKDSNAVIVIDTLTKNIIKKIDVGQGPIGLASDPQGQYVYVANSYSNNISVIDTRDNDLVNTIGVGGEPRYLGIYQRYIVVSNSQSNSVNFIDRYSSKIMSTVFVSSQPGNLIPGLRGWVYVAGERSHDISFITPALNIAPRKLPAGKHPSGMALDKDRKLLYVANLMDNTLSVFDLIREEEIKRIDVGDRPYDLVLVSD
jgi:YVTN family beta-propeller protein